MRIQYTNNDSAITSDQFDPNDVKNLYLDYTAKLYTGTVDVSGVRAVDTNNNNKDYGLRLGEGILRVRAVEDGFNVAFTPDGPRGPKYRMKTGPVLLASLTGGKILPISVNASRYWQLRSWDNFQIPKPGATLRLVMGEGIAVPPNLTEEQLEEWRLRVETALMAVTRD